MITEHLLMPEVFKRVLASYGGYQDKVLEIRMLRNDITEDEIIELSTKMYNSTTMSMKSILDEFIFLAQLGESFPEEKKGT